MSPDEFTQILKKFDTKLAIAIDEIQLEFPTIDISVEEIEDEGSMFAYTITFLKGESKYQATIEFNE